MSDTPLIGTTAIVTGASRGFGRATVIALAHAGAHVIGIARSESGLGTLHDELGTSFTPAPADLTDPDVAARLIAEHRPRILVLNAGATPDAAPVQAQTWEGFSRTWEVDVHHVFQFVREALVVPLDAGSVVISFSSGAALAGSPLSGGYAGAKATIKFISSYAATEAGRQGLGIRFVSVLPQLTPATELGSTFVDSYAAYAGTTREEFLAGFGAPLTAEQVGTSIVELATNDRDDSPSYLLTARGLSPVEP